MKFIPLNTFFVAIVSISLSVAAQFLLKIGTSAYKEETLSGHQSFTNLILSYLANLYIISGFFLYGLSAVIWLSVLSKWDVSKAYPLVGVGFLLSLVVGALSGEQITFERVIGVTLIAIGVFFVAGS